MGPLLFFRSADEVACAITMDKIDVINAGDQKITLMLKGGAGNASIIELGCADGESENVLKVLAAAIAGLPYAKRQDRLVVIADDVDDEYICAGLTTVAITIDAT
tara:strand:+ start:1755 stop:2069 length:315 start_codon:yes stop_codon:yes gene_type:complete